jgi:hypothetical protein
MQQAKIFTPFFQLQIQIIPNFFDRYQQFSMGSEISGFRRNFGKIGREKNPWPTPNQNHPNNTTPARPSTINHLQREYAGTGMGAEYKEANPPSRLATTHTQATTSHDSANTNPSCTRRLTSYYGHRTIV